jgi:DNA-binding PadR family transcriptional regulator
MVSERVRQPLPGLTPTSYAILGLLAIRSWTTYELAQQMQRAVGQFWPRAESRLYEEPKKLVTHGLASAAPGQVGQRRRTVYSITPDGRRALADWIPNAPAPPTLECEGMVKVFFAEHGSRDDLLATISRIHDWTGERLAASAGIAGGYLAGEGSFEGRLPWLVLTGRFLDEFVFAVRRWASWAATVVETWPEDITQADPAWEELRGMADRVNAALMEGARRRRPPAGGVERDLN